MKKIFYNILGITMLFIGFTACEDNTDGFYDNIPRIYFNADSLNYSFGDQLAEYTRHTFYYPVKMLGMKATHEMKYKIEVDEAQSTAQKDIHYVALQEEYSLLPDSVNAYFPIELIRDKMPDTDTSFRLALKLVANDEFQTGITESLTAVLTMNNYLEEPAWWTPNLGSTGPYQPGKYQRLIAYYGSPEKGEQATASYLEIMYAFKTQVYDYAQEHPEAGFIFEENIWWPFE